MSDDRMTEAAGLVDNIYALNETIKDHESSIRVLKEDVARKMDRLRLLVEGTGVSEVAGSMARAKFGIKSVPKVFDWQSLYGFIQQTGAWDLLHKRIGATAWEARVNAGINVPGVEQVVVPSVEVKGKR
jgi:hypothetical protein